MSQIIKYAYIKNFKWIDEIEVNNPWRFVWVFWENWAWKSSFLDAITNAIKMKRWWKEDLLKIGEDEWEVTIDFDDFSITRTFWEKWKLKVTREWEVVKNPQRRLDDIFKWSIADPQKFLNMEWRKQIIYMLKIFWKDEEFEKLEKERQPLHDERKDLHRTVLAKEEEVEKTDVSEFSMIDGIDESIDIDKLQDELRSLEDHNRTKSDIDDRLIKWREYVETIKRRSNNTSKEIDDIDEKIEQLQKERKEKQQSIVDDAKEETKAETVLLELQEQVDAFEEKDTTEVREKITNYWLNAEKNAEVKARKNIYESNEKKAKLLRIEWKKLDDQVKNIQEKQNDLISWIKLWYDIIVEEWVMMVKANWVYVPIDELNTASQLELATEICLSWPNEVKIITIENANALDPKNMEKVKKMVEKKWWQCFLETVYPTKYDVINIEDWKIVK